MINSRITRSLGSSSIFFILFRFSSIFFTSSMEKFSFLFFFFLLFMFSSLFFTSSIEKFSFLSFVFFFHIRRPIYFLHSIKHFFFFCPVYVILYRGVLRLVFPLSVTRS